MMNDVKDKIEGLIKKGHEFRQFINFEMRASEEEGMYVEGYAATFESPTVLWTSLEGTEFSEQIDKRAFESADMSDVIFNYNHSGKVMARTRNKTLTLNVDDKGLFIRAKLDGTEEGRKLYDEIKGGYIDRMSFSFSVNKSSYDKEKHLRTIEKVKKLYDVSAVDIPAYDDTSISARSSFELEKEKEQKLLERAQLRKRLALRTKTILSMKGETNE